ncbi:MAG: putative Histidine kinase [Candidatus Thorarchaeota archaeon]|nr:MAG: putative Histidine kinase [Candidatus Thorarchaeota archaeon]
MPNSQHHKIAEKLREEEWFKSTLDAIPEPAYLFELDNDGDIRLVMINQHVQTLTEGAILSEIGSKIEDIFPKTPEVLNAIRHAVDKMKLTRIEGQMKGSGLHGDRWFIWTVTPFSENTILLITSDITESKIASEALEESEREKSIVLDSMIQHVNYYGTDDMSLLWSNKAAADSLGLSIDDMKGKTCHELWHGRAEPCEICPVIKARETGEKQEAEVITPDGRLWHIEGIPVFDETELVGLVEITMEITEKRKSEEVLKKNHENLRTLFDTIDDMVFILSKDGLILEINSAVLSKLGYSRNELITENFLMVHPPEQHQEAEEIMHEMLGETRESCNIPLLTKNGERIPVETQVTIGLWGNETAIFGISRDISIQEEAMRQVREAKMRVELFNDLMVHDLNNINQGVMAGLELLLFDPATPKHFHERIEIALQQIKRSIDLISKVRKFSHVDKEPIRLIPVKVVPVLKSAIESNRHTFPDKKVHLTFYAQDEDIQVMADDFIYDAFYNIIHNAFKHSRSKEIILEIEVLPFNNDYISISIADDGPGISEDIKESLFHRMDEKKRVSSGIGFTLVNRIMERCQGKILIEDRAVDGRSQGTKFIIHIPRVRGG